MISPEQNRAQPAQCVRASVASAESITRAVCGVSNGISHSRTLCESFQRKRKMKPLFAEAVNLPAIEVFI